MKFFDGGHLLLMFLYMVMQLDGISYVIFFTLAFLLISLFYTSSVFFLTSRYY